MIVPVRVIEGDWLAVMAADREAVADRVRDAVFVIEKVELAVIDCVATL